MSDLDSWMRDVVARADSDGRAPVPDDPEWMLTAWRQYLRSGCPVEVKTAFGDWISAATVSGIEPTHRDGRKIHDFPVVFVTTDDENCIPWPLEAIRPRSGGDT